MGAFVSILIAVAFFLGGLAMTGGLFWGLWLLLLKSTDRPAPAAH